MLQYCPRCAHELCSSYRYGRERPWCEQCGFIHFAQPKLAVAMLAGSPAGLLLVRRGIEPKKGLWTFPSGYVDLGETPEEAAARETIEETGAIVRVDGLVGVYADRDNPVVLIVYQGRVIDGQIEALDEAEDARFFDTAHLPPLAFEHDDRIVQEWLVITGKQSAGAGRGA